MRLLVDSHVVIWYVDQEHLLTPKVHAAIDDPNTEILVSAGTIWEIAIKVGLGKLTLSGSYLSWMSQALVTLRAIILPITVEYADVQTSLPDHHGDPFDRIIIAQALADTVKIASADSILDLYGVQRLW